MAALMASISACQCACDGSSETAFAFSRLLAILRVLVWVLAIGSKMKAKSRIAWSEYIIIEDLLLLLMVVLLLALVVFLTVRLLLLVLLPIWGYLLVLPIGLLLVALVVVSLGLGLVVVAAILRLLVVVVRHAVRGNWQRIGRRIAEESRRC